ERARLSGRRGSRLLRVGLLSVILVGAGAIGGALLGRGLISSGRGVSRRVGATRGGGIALFHEYVPAQPRAALFVAHAYYPHRRRPANTANFGHLSTER